MTYPPNPPPQWNPPPQGPYGGSQQPYQWSGYGQASPGYGPNYGPPKRNNTPWIVAAIAAIVVIALVAGGLLWRLNSGGDEADDRAGTASTTSESTTPESTDTSPTARPACEGKVASPTPQTPPDWIAVASPRGLGYDVPPDWTVNSCTSLVGWEKPCPDGPFGFCPVRMMTGSAEMPNKQCPDGSRALTGVPGANNTDDLDEAVQREAQIVDDAYTSRNGVVPSVSLSPPRKLTVDGQPAVQIIATVTGIEADECTGPSALHSMLATKVDGQPGSVMFIVALVQGYPGAPDPDLIDRFVATLRRN